MIVSRLQMFVLISANGAKDAQATYVRFGTLTRRVLKLCPQAGDSQEPPIVILAVSDGIARRRHGYHDCAVLDGTAGCQRGPFSVCRMRGDKSSDELWRKLTSLSIWPRQWVVGACRVNDRVWNSAREATEVCGEK